MATNKPTQSGPFDNLDILIRDTFDIIIATATERRDHFLKQLNETKECYKLQEETRVRELRDLEKMIGQLNDMSVQQNKIAKLHKEHINNVLQELDQCKVPVPVPILSFNSYGINNLVKQLNKLGCIEETAHLYKHKIQPIKSFGKDGTKKGELNLSLDIKVDHSDRIFVADHWNKRVQVFTPDGKFVAEIGKGHLKCPYSLEIMGQFLFVSDWRQNAVFKFDLTNYKLELRSGEGELSLPFGVTSDTNEEVFVADMNNHRVAVCSSSLEVLSEIGKDQLKYPRYVLIHLEKVLVADNNETHNIHMYSKSGILIRHIIKLENGTDHIFMCLDRFSHILVSDDKGKSIQIYTMDGQLVHRIESKGFPRGIVVTKECNIICARFENVIDFY